MAGTIDKGGAGLTGDWPADDRKRVVLFRDVSECAGRTPGGVPIEGAVARLSSDPERVAARLTVLPDLCHGLGKGPSSRPHRVFLAQVLRGAFLLRLVGLDQGSRGTKNKLASLEGDRRFSPELDLKMGGGIHSRKFSIQPPA